MNVIQAYAKQSLAGKSPQIGYNGAVLRKSRLFQNIFRMRNCLLEYR